MDLIQDSLRNENQSDFMMAHLFWLESVIAAARGVIHIESEIIRTQQKM
jgi:hypothetical protein